MWKVYILYFIEIRSIAVKCICQSNYSLLSSFWNCFSATVDNQVQTIWNFIFTDPEIIRAYVFVSPAMKERNCNNWNSGCNRPLEEHCSNVVVVGFRRSAISRSICWKFRTLKNVVKILKFVRPHQRLQFSIGFHTLLLFLVGMEYSNSIIRTFAWFNAKSVVKDVMMNTYFSRKINFCTKCDVIFYRGFHSEEHAFQIL